LKDNILTRIFALFAVSVVVLAAMAAYALRTINRSVATSDWVNHSHATIYQFEHIIARLQQAEGRTHAYALTGDPRDLATARGTFDQLAEHLDSAKALTRDTPAAQAALERIENQLHARETWAQSLWAARTADQPEKVQALLAADAGSTATTTMLSAIAASTGATGTRTTPSEASAVASQSCQSRSRVRTASGGRALSSHAVSLASR
jgi:CHASE3 domain sensor protein